MAVRSVVASIKICKPQQLKKNFLKEALFVPFLSHSFLRKPSFCDVIHKVLGHEPAVTIYGTPRYLPGGILWIHSTPSLDMVHKASEPAEITGANMVANSSGESTSLDMVHKAAEPAEITGANIVANSSGEAKPKRKKLKGKRAVVRWLKSFRFKKKKNYERMTAEEKILFKLRKARKKEERLLEALKKLEPKESSETTHDPEILTPEEHFYFLKMGRKSKNYVPVGRRGVYQGVILNMHLHWKKHETLQVVVKTFTADEVKEMAVELARLSGGIVLDIQEDNTIIMYRGKNYSQPPTEIMSPRVTLPRKKALDKSKYMDALRAVRRHIPRLELDLELLRARAESQAGADAETESSVPDLVTSEVSSLRLEATKKLNDLAAGNDNFNEEDDSVTVSEIASDSEDLSDIFETDRETDDEKDERLYLDEFDRIPVRSNRVEEDFEAHLRQISAESKKAKSIDNDLDAELDDVDRVVLQAAELLKKRRR